MSPVRGGTVLRLLVVLLACLLAGAVAWVAGSVHASQGPAGTERRVSEGTEIARGSSALPVAAQRPISAAIGNNERAYWVHGVVAATPSQDLRLRFTNGGVVVASARSSVRLGLGGLGRADGPAVPLVAARPHAVRNRVTYDRGAVDEWYANGPVGLEQGFDILRRPHGGGLLTVSIPASGDVRLESARDGAVVLEGPHGGSLLYTGLSARDALGHSLPARLGHRGGSLLIYVDDRSARYPVRIDPFVQQAGPLLPSGATGEPQLGQSVAVSSDGNTVLIGAPYTGYSATTGQAPGATYVYVRSGGTWGEQTELVGSGAVGDAFQGSSVALSADGNTAIVGGPSDNGYNGAAWVFTRSGTTWTQVSKLVALGVTGGPDPSAEQGWSVALSGDGGTALLGAPYDGGNNVGAAWVFVKQNGTWNQQGSKLTATTNPAQQGYSVALSSNGSTALVGSPDDTTAEGGGAWVYTRSGTTWSQQGSELVGSTALEESAEGQSVALSSDGNTALIGGNNDTDSGGVWVFTRSGSTWSQQGSELFGTGNTGNAGQGWSVALSSDGNTALVGGPFDNSSTGAAWLFTRSGSTWSQLGSKLVGTGGKAGSDGDGIEQGYAVALSGDGNTAVLGGPANNNGTGAAWAFVNVPAVTAVSPAAGPSAGGNQVAITGTNFTGATGVSFGSNAATNVTVVNSTTITATVPASTGLAHQNGTAMVDVTVTTQAGTSATSAADQYTYYAVPTVTAVSPSTGPTAAGTAVTITGTHFVAGATVAFGANPATNVSVVSSGSITATAPAGSAGTVDVTVTSPGGTSATSSADQYTYVAAPTVTSINPTAGPTAGGNTVTITGTNFTGTTAVSFGQVAATSFTINSATSISAIAPAEGAGTVNIAVTTPGGASASTSADQYTYTAAPTVTAVNPTSGPTAGGTSITVTGTNLSGATAVLFGSTPATSYTVTSSTQISATAPAGAGVVDVTVTTPGGTSATSAADRYGYGGCTDEFSPQSGDDWGTAANWSKGTVPTSSDVACWPVGTDVTVSSSDSSATAMSVEGGDLTIAGGSLSLAGTAGSTLVDLTETGGGLNGPGALALSGNFSWTGGTISSRQAIAITQAAGKTFSITGTNQEYLEGGSIGTQSPVTISDTSLIATNSPTLTTTSTVTFGPGSYQANGGASLSISAAGFDTTGATTIPNYALSLTGNASSLGGSLTTPVFNSAANTTLTVGAAIELSVGQGTIQGTITGQGTYNQGSGTTTFPGAATLSTGTVVVGSGLLSTSSEATYAAGATTVAGGTLDLADAATTGSYTESLGGMNGPGSLALTGAFSWTGGQIAANQTIAITQAAGQTFSITGTNQEYLEGGSISTQSPVTISDTSFIATNSPTLTTTSTVTFGPGSYQANGGVSLAITGTGVITTGATTLTNYSVDVDGTTSSLGGSLTMPSLSSTSGSSITVPSGIDLSVAGGTINGTITGAGTYTQTSGTSTIASGGTLSISAVTVAGGTLTVNSGAGYAAGGATTISGGTLNIGPASASTGNLTETGGALNGPGALALSGNFSWTDGAISSSQAIAITQPAGQTFSITGTSQDYLEGGSISTQSPVTISNTSFIATNSPTLTTTSTVTFGPGSYQTNGGASLTISAAGFGISGNTTLPNYSLVQTGGTTTVSGGVTLSSGPFTVRGGVVQDDGTVEATTALTGGTLTGVGVVDGSLANTSGTVTPGDSPSPGTLNVTASYSQGSAGTLQIAINGTTAGQHSVLNVGGEITLDGTLAIVPSAAYASSAKPGDRTPFLPYGSLRTGEFASTTVNPALADGATITPDYSVAANIYAVVGNPPAPTVTGLDPTVGPAGGGTTVTITGTGFTGATAVNFGSNAATSFTVNTATSITAVAPAGSGTADVTVTGPGGTSATSAADKYSYTPAPTVTQIAPTAGPTGGGTSVTIIGTGFTGANAVDFGSNAATNVTVVSGSQITATAPAGGAGTVDVTVTTPGGTSPTSTADHYTYDAAPTVTNVNPTAGPTVGGNSVTITGTGFTGTTAVEFGSTTATSFTINSATSITATAPAESAGTVNITVTTPGGTSATGTADHYTYTSRPTVTQVAPTAGPTGGGTSVTITGTNLTGATAVSFGSTSAASFTVNTATSITAVDPAQGAGTIDVTVTTPGGTSGASAADRFTYNAPQPSSPPPASPATSPPAVSGGSPSTETISGAAVSGTVNPESLATTAFFQYGLDPSDRGPGASTTLYDQSTPVQTVGADSAIHTVSASLSGLVPGALYHIRLVATNSDGTTFGPDATFTTPQAPAPPAPVLGTTENATPVTGTVFIKSPSGAFVPLTGATQIRTGTEIDALRGSLELVASVGKHKTEHGIFGGAIFRLSQTGRGALKGLTTLTLVESAFHGAPSYALCKAHSAGDPTATAASSRSLQLLHASAHGKFRTSGRYSAATVLGTKWTIADRCDGTLVHDITDSVAVNDFVHHKTIILHAGQSYLARART